MSVEADLGNNGTLAALGLVLMMLQTLQGCQKQTALVGQDLCRTNLPQHELESILVILTIDTVLMMADMRYSIIQSSITRQV